MEKSALMTTVILVSFKKERVRLFANIFYYVCLGLVALFLLLGVLASVGLVANSQSKIHEYGVSIYKYPLVNSFLIMSAHGSAFGNKGLYEERLVSLNGCNAADYKNTKELLTCAKLDTSNTLTVTIITSGEEKTLVGQRGDAKPFILNIVYLAIDAFLLLLSLFLSLLLFFKARRHLSGYLLSLVLLLNACESIFFFTGSIIFDANQIETIRINFACVIGPFAMYFFPQAFNAQFWKNAQYFILCVCVSLMLISYNFLPFIYFVASVSLTLLVLIVHFILKYRSVLNTKERKQVKTMLLSVIIGLILYVSLLNFGGFYGFLIGRYVIALCGGLGVFFALMRYGLWQVETIISKSAALSLLSIIAFSLWAGLDQGLQALLNQTMGLSNKTFTAFFAAVISSLFVVPVYNFVSKSCDAFFNKELYQLKRLLSKEILVFAETQTLQAFTEQLSTRILSLTGAHLLNIEFMDQKRLAEPVKYTTTDNKTAESDAFISKESFDFQLEGILYVKLELIFTDRRINKEIKHELEEGTDEMARALASCCRWNFLENMGGHNQKLAPHIGAS